MQNKGIVIVTAVLLTLASIFYLSFSAATKYYDSQAAKIKDPIAQQDYKDSVKYLGIYSYQKCLETQIGLGLDLKGGMNVILEVSVPDVLENLADHKVDAAFVKSMKEARAEHEVSQSDFITLFINAFKKNAPGRHLSEIFATQQLQGKVSPNSSDKDVEKVLRTEVQAAIDNSFLVVRTRIDKFGVVQPNIQKLEGQQGRIMVEMPGINEPERVRKLLQGSANLEFWETYNSDEIIPYLSQLNQREANHRSGVKEEVADSAANDTAAVAAVEKAEAKVQAKASFKTKKNAKADDAASMAEAKKQNPLFSIFQPSGNGALSLVGYASARDTAEVNKIIYSALAKQILPADCRLLWSAKPADGIQAKNIYELHAIKVTTTNGRAPIEGDVVTDAKDQFNNLTGSPEVSMTMNSDGARRWAALTKANVGKAIAIVLDGTVYSAPRVNGEISGGQSSISGNFTIEDTKDLANTLKSGRMPAPAHIVQEEVVGPTLGAQSIQQGFISFIFAFIILMIYMVVMYDFIPGMVANGALLLNLFFTMGIMASFQAALTMPGIAGIVLALGMAVDANVLIYERTKEELKKGLGTKQALSLGYSNAFSAIFDSNLTSIITGIILYVFGTGPIRGFATTLIIGICCSFFTAVFLTRLVYENRLKHDKWTKQNFSTRVSRNFMANKNFAFMSSYKTSFTVFGIVILIMLGSFFVRGLSKGIDFTGGRNYVVVLEKQTEPEQVKAALTPLFKGATVNALALGTDGKTIRISTNYKIESNNPAIDNEVEDILYKGLHGAGLVTQGSVEAFKNPDVRAGGSIVSSTKVGPAVAKDITHGAIISVLFALAAIFLYILVRFRNVAFSVGSTVALVVDATIVIGFFSLLWDVVPFSLEIDQTFIGAILTVIGYSINDKVVVFDRIRENLTLHKKMDLQELFNKSLNETLARTINTSFSTLIVLLCIFCFGGESTRSFSFAMLLGVIFGTLSSIFMAAPVAYLTLGRKIKHEEAAMAEAVEVK
ncbi:MAG: protein translocase subunit SecDF [Prevotella sp.]|uniref:protein translocase subunit SecDF n=1 Tax=Leyella stercorea TaxID=363265 RepID=UPI0025FAC3DC|nr:protein translocase subunit SecDF [Prevotella sp.]MDD7644045.1 protein translocase subunit SecDF [Leyella stercorea]MDY4088148.1 protein translocase subunit SecDF [Prevotella sp.]